MQSGTRIGQYEIVAPIGAGGMGVVYRAHDSRLGRDVAVKLLPEAFATDPNRLARFEREARVLASLNHPNVAAVYAVEQQAIVMELVEGPTLADLLRTPGGASVPLPVTDALRIARQIAEGLEAAHELGIVHRDLKPANIKVRDDGTVKVLDFGLAKALDPAVAVAADAGSGPQTPHPGHGAPTMTSPAMTRLGMVLGTAAYMAPEQARGKSVDRRADVWAFGVVLYEMLSGKRLFDTSEVSDTLAAVLTKEPDLGQLPASTPAGVRRLLARCLAKDKRDRLDSMSVARQEIDEALRAPAGTGAPIVKSTGLAWSRAGVLAAVTLAAGVALGLLWPGKGSHQAARLVISEIGAPPGVISAFHNGFALSPDGSTLAFGARDANGVRQIWLRRLDSATANPLPDTEGGLYPFWSPDGGHVGFFTQSSLRRVPVTGGQAQTICAAAGFFPTGSWGTSGDILFGILGERGPQVYRVPATGGEPEFAAEGEGIRPEWLPDGRRFLYAGGPRGAWGLRLASIGGGPSTVLMKVPLGEFAYSRAGYVFSNQGDALMVQRFNNDTGTLSGEPVAVSGRVGTPRSWFALSSTSQSVTGFVKRSSEETGTPGDPWARLRWVNRRGEYIGDLGEPARYWSLRLAPDGERATVNPDDNLWLLNPTRRHVRLTTGLQSAHGVWSPDGSEIAFELGEDIARKRLAGDEPPVILPNAPGMVSDWARDGQWLLMERVSPDNPSRDLTLYDLKEKKERPWASTRFNEQQGRFSPDGKWIAYASDATGHHEVYVKTRDGQGQPIGISVHGGSHPIWRRDGRELFYLGPEDEVMAVPIEPAGNSLRVGEPARLFKIPLNDITRASYAPYDVAPDGQRFLLNVPDRPSPLFFLQGLDAYLATKAGK